MASTIAFLEYDACIRCILEVAVGQHLAGRLRRSGEYDRGKSSSILMDGSFYGSNRGSNTIAAFAINPSTGQLSAVERVSTGGNWPRNFRLSPDGRFLLVANLRSDEVRVLSVDSRTGRLSPTAGRVAVPFADVRAVRACALGSVSSEDALGSIVEERVGLRCGSLGSESPRGAIGCARLRVDGSGDAYETGDVDILVTLPRGVGGLALGRLLMDLQDWTGRRVDVITEGFLYPAFRDRVLQEAEML